LRPSENKHEIATYLRRRLSELLKAEMTQEELIAAVPTQMRGGRFGLPFDDMPSP
jgi:hypothetical protein